MWIDRHAAAVVGDGEVAVGCEFDFDEGCMARQRLVHRVVDHFGEQVMQRLLVGAADIHAGTAADGFQTFQHLDVLGGIAAFGPAAGRRGAGGFRRFGGTFRRRATEQIGFALGGFGSRFCFSHVIRCLNGLSQAVGKTM